MRCAAAPLPLPRFPVFPVQTTGMCEKPAGAADAAGDDSEYVNPMDTY